MANIVTRSDERLAGDVDEIVRVGVARNRSELARVGLEQLVDRQRRHLVGLALAEAYRRQPQSSTEVTGVSHATRALVEEESW